MLVFLNIINILLLVGSGFFIYKISGLGFDLRTVISIINSGQTDFLWNLIVILTALAYLLLVTNIILNLFFLIKYFKKISAINRQSIIVSVITFIFVFLTYLITINYSYCFPDSINKLFRVCNTGYQDQINYMFDFGSYTNVQKSHDTNNFDPYGIIWKTYTSPTMKISFDYPSELLLGIDDRKVGETKDKQDILYHKIYIGNEPSQVAIPTVDSIDVPFEVDFYPNNILIDYSFGKPLNEARNEFKKGIISSFTQKTFVTKDIFVDNKSAVYYAGVYDPYFAMDEKYHWTIYIETYTGIYLIKNNFIIKDQYFANDVLNKLISSFKFLE